MTSDYRNTKYCPTLENVIEKKQELEREIIDKHPRQKIMYNKVHDRKSEFNSKFAKIYNYKCAYCGVSMKALPKLLFEVDHYIAESSYEDKELAGKVENLVYACYQCNRKKKDLVISDSYVKRLCTDDGSIAAVFSRDEDYYIRIMEDYKRDEFINEFYKKMQLDHQSRRLDYLLMNMRESYDRITDANEKAELADAIFLLQDKRNTYI